MFRLALAEAMGHGLTRGCIPMTDGNWTSIRNAAGAARVSYWSEAMERARRLLDQMSQYPVAECGEGFVSIPDAATDARAEMTFSATKQAGTFDRLFFIRRGLIQDLLRAAKAMNERGWILKIEDGYRTQEMQTLAARRPEVFDGVVKMCLWECSGRTPSVEMVLQRWKVLAANYPCNGTHMMGAAVDVSVFRRDDGSEVWRGAPFPVSSEYSPMDCPFVSPEEHANRIEITRLMERHGFMHFPGEFWHYNKGDALYQIYTKSGRPAVYGPVHWDQRTNQVEPYTDAHSPLTSEELLKQLIDEAMERISVEEQIRSTTRFGSSTTTDLPKVRRI
jgi:D-alanyl-D-alanine dipeptidase